VSVIDVPWLCDAGSEPAALAAAKHAARTTATPPDKNPILELKPSRLII
jgi:hypothetical protein